MRLCRHESKIWMQPFNFITLLITRTVFMFTVKTKNKVPEVNTNPSNHQSLLIFSSCLLIHQLSSFFPSLQSHLSLSLLDHSSPPPCLYSVSILFLPMIPSAFPASFSLFLHSFSFHYTVVSLLLSPVVFCCVSHPCCNVTLLEPIHAGCCRKEPGLNKSACTRYLHAHCCY